MNSQYELRMSDNTRVLAVLSRHATRNMSAAVQIYFILSASFLILLYFFFRLCFIFILQSRSVPANLNEYDNADGTVANLAGRVAYVSILSPEIILIKKFYINHLSAAVVTGISRLKEN